MEKQNVRNIKMVDRALEVLDILRKERSPLGVNEIAKSCELNPSTAFRILKTLEVNAGFTSVTMALHNRPEDQFCHREK